MAQGGHSCAEIAERVGQFGGVEQRQVSAADIARGHARHPLRVQKLLASPAIAGRGEVEGTQRVGQVRGRVRVRTRHGRELCGTHRVVDGRLRGACGGAVDRVVREVGDHRIEVRPAQRLQRSRGRGVYAGAPDGVLLAGERLCDERMREA